MTLSSTLRSIKAAHSLFDEHTCHLECLRWALLLSYLLLPTIYSIVVCGNYWLFLSSVDLQVVCEPPHAKPVAQLLYDLIILAKSDSREIPPLRRPLIAFLCGEKSDCRLMCHLRLLLWWSLISLEPGCLLPCQCLSSDSVGFLNTYPRSGSKNGGKYGSGLKVKSTLRYHKREPLLQCDCDRRCFWQLISESWLW